MTSIIGLECKRSHLYMTRPLPTAKLQPKILKRMREAGNWTHIEKSAMTIINFSIFCEKKHKSCHHHIPTYM